MAKMYGTTPEISWEGKTYTPGPDGAFELPREAFEILQHHGIKLGMPAEQPASEPKKSAEVVDEPAKEESKPAEQPASEPQKPVEDKPDKKPGRRK